MRPRGPQTRCSRRNEGVRRLRPKRRRARDRALNEARLSALQDLMGSLDEDQAGALAHALELILTRREEIAAYRPAAQGAAR
jgi:hypothetical protein